MCTGFQHSSRCDHMLATLSKREKKAFIFKRVQSILYVDIQEFMLIDETFILKEIVIFYKNLDVAERKVIRKPHSFNQLMEEDKKQVR